MADDNDPKVPKSPRTRRPWVREGKTEQGPIVGRGTKITSLPTEELKRRDREAREQFVSKHPGGSGSLIYESYAIWFMTQPTLLKANATGLDVFAVVGVSTEFAPRQSNNYFGVWPGASAPSDADVKAGVGALLHTSALGVEHGDRIDHTWDDPSVVLDVGSTYALHWYAETADLVESVRSATIIFVFQNSQPNGAPYITGTPIVGQTLICQTDNITDPDGMTTPNWQYQWLRNGQQIAGATSNTYTLTDDDKRADIGVWVRFTDDEGTLEGPLHAPEVGPVAPINYPATGQPVITGQLIEGQTVTLGRGTVDDQNGMSYLTNHAISWRLDGTTTIPGATDPTYTIMESDVGSTLAGSWSFTDDDGYAEGPLWSAESAVITPFNRAATGKPGISGTQVEGEILTCTTGTVADYNGVPAIGTWTFQWTRDGVDIPAGMLQTYTLVAADVGTQIRVKVWFTDLDGFSEGPLTSDPTTNIPEANVPATGQPTIAGTVDVGQQLTCNEGTVADANGVPSIATWTFQWERGTTPIATGRHYTITPSDAGNTLRVGVSFTDLAGYAEGILYSANTIPVPGANQPPTGVPAITGTVLEGETLTCDTSPISDPDGMSDPRWEYQWQRDQLDIAGQMAVTYTITANDVGKKLRVYVHFTDDGDTYEGPLYSLETITVVRYNRPATGVPTITGTAAVGQTLTAQEGSVDDANGVPPINEWDFQWNRGGVAINGATSRTYVVDVLDQAETLTVDVVFMDNDGYFEGPLESLPTATVPVVEHSQDFTPSTLGSWTHARSGTTTVNDYRGDSITVEDGDPAFVGGNYSAPTWTDESVGYGIQLTSADQLTHTVSPAVTDGFSGQFIFRLRDSSDTVGATVLFEHTNAGKTAGVRGEVLAGGDIRVTFLLNGTSPAITFAGPFAAGARDIRYRKNGSDNAAWLDGSKQAVTDANILAAALDSLEAGGVATIEHQIIRYSPYPKDDTAIGAWGTWTEPLPIITQQPADIDFGGAPPPSVSSSLALLFSDLVDGFKSGWHDDSSKGAAVTVWGSGFDSATLSNNKIIFTLSGTAYELPAGHVVEVVQDPHVFFLQRLTFHLWGQLPDGDHTFVVKVGEFETEQLPFHVRSTGRHFYFDANAASNGTGTWADPFRRPTDHFTSGSASDGSTAAGDHYWLKAGTYTETNGVIYLYGSRCVSAAENNRISFSAVPTHDVLLENWLTHGGSNIAIWGFGGSSEPDGTKSWFVFSKFRIDGGKGSINLSETNEVRVVGCECNGLKGDSTTTGDIAWGGSNGIACNNIKILGCEFKGGTTQKSTDHAVYPGSGGAFYGTQDIAYCYIHDNDYANGQLIGYHFNQSGQQRIPDGERYMGSRCHHNLVDTRIPGTPAHGQLSTVGIRVSIIDARDAGRLPAAGKKEGEPVYVYNNVVICDSAEATENASYGIIVTSNTADSYVCNNTIINGTHKGAVGFEGDSPSNGITFRANYSGNVMTSDADNGNPYFRYSGGTAVNVTITAADNVYFNGNSGNLIPNESNAIQSDPQMTYDLANLATTSITAANGSPITDALQTENVSGRTRDYNHRVVSGPPYDAGAIKPEEPA